MRMPGQATVIGLSYYILLIIQHAAPDFVCQNFRPIWTTPLSSLAVSHRVVTFSVNFSHLVYF